MQKILALFMVFNMLVSMCIPSYAVGGQSGFKDVKGHWAEYEIVKYEKKGFVHGRGEGIFDTEGNLTKAEMITMINRLFGLTKKADNQFGDVGGNEWYSDNAEITSYYDYAEGDVLDGDKISTRLDILKALDSLISPPVTNVLAPFTDTGNLTDDEKDIVNRFYAAGFIAGDGNGNFMATKNLTRAEMVVFFDNSLGYTVKTQEDANNIPEGIRVTIIGQNINIVDKDIEDLYISPGVHTDVNITDSSIGDIIIASENSNINFNNTNAEKLRINPRAKNLEVNLKNNSEVDILDTNFDGTIKGDDNSKINELNLNGGNISLEGVEAQVVNVNEKSNLEMDIKCDIDKLNADAPLNITGEGQIVEVEITSEDVTIETTPQYYEVDKDVAADIGDEEITNRNDNPRPSDRDSSPGNGSSKNKPSNHSPTVVSAIADQVWTVNTKITDIDLSDVFTDSDKDTLSCSISSTLPTGVTLVDDVITGTPTAASPKSSYTVTASDGKGGSVSHSFDITVNSQPVTNNPPVVVSGQISQTGTARPQSADGNTIVITYSQNVSSWFTDSDNDTLTYSVVSATNDSVSVVSSVSLPANSSSLAYTPVASHANNNTVIVLKANDGKADSTGNVTITITVGPVPADLIVPAQGTKVKEENGVWVVDNDGTHIGIWTVEDLQLIGTDATTDIVYDTDGDGSYLDENYVLMEDIDFNDNSSYRDSNNKSIYTSGEGFEPIGDMPTSFSGSFDGNRHTISNLYTNRTTTHTGLFGRISGNVKELGLIDVDVTGKYMTGSLAGEIREGGKVVNCYSTGNVNCYTEENVNSSLDTFTGGFAGYVNYLYSTVENCYTTCAVDGLTSTGGFTGGDYAIGSKSKIYNSIAFNNIVTNSATNTIGRFVGYHRGGLLENNYAYENMTDGSNVMASGSLTDENGANITQAQFKNVDFFTDPSNWADTNGDSTVDVWDFDTIWEIKTGSDRPTFKENNSDDGIFLADMAGSGTEIDPFIIMSIEDLLLVGSGINTDGKNYSLSASYKLGDDLDFTDNRSYEDATANFDADGDGRANNIKDELTVNSTLPNALGFYPIGAQSNPFKGRLDGDGKTIKNLYINRSDVDYVGLFGFGDKQTIKKLALEDVNINYTGRAISHYVGALIGMNGGTGTDHLGIDRCYATGNINVTALNHSTTGYTCTSRTGGLTGANSDNSMIDSYANIDTLIDVQTTENIHIHVGGLQASQYSSAQNNTYSTGSIEVINNKSTDTVIIMGLGSTYDGPLKDNISFLQSIESYNPTTSRYSGIFRYADAARVSWKGYANENIKVNGSSQSTETNKYIDMSYEQFANETFYTTADNWILGAWDFTDTWEIKTGADRPTLIGIGDDDGLLYPVVTKSIQDITTTTGSAINIIDLDDVFTHKKTLSYSITSGTLPAGISLSGNIISGTPIEVTSRVGVEIEITATDGSHTIVDTFNVKILDSISSISYNFEDFSDKYNASTIDAFTSTIVNNHNNSSANFTTSIPMNNDDTVWKWNSTASRGGGFILKMPDTSIAEEYTIGIRFLYDTISSYSYTKIIDFKNSSTDEGLYFYGPNLTFYGSAKTGTTTYSQGDIIDVIMTRSSIDKLVTVYSVKDGVYKEEFNFIDTNNLAVLNEINNELNIGFFHDDNDSGSSEATNGGAVYSLKISDFVINENLVSTFLNEN